MKKLISILLIVFIATPVFADLTTQEEKLFKWWLRDRYSQAHELRELPQYLIDHLPITEDKVRAIVNQYKVEKLAELQEVQDKIEGTKVDYQ